MNKEIEDISSSKTLILLDDLRRYFHLIKRPERFNEVVSMVIISPGISNIIKLYL